jgi:uncharacterized protein YqgC (DUF456 family)
MTPTIPTDLLITIGVGAAMLFGLAGIIAPVLPGLGLQWGAALAYGLLIGWGTWGPWLFLLMSVFTVVGFVADIGMSAAGAKVRGASLWSVAIGLVAGLLGLILFSLLGALVGLLLGTFLAEYRRVNDPRKAMEATLGMGVGYGLSYGFKMLMGVSVFGLWLIWVATNGA